MNVPNWWSLVLLTFAAFRIWRLIAEDTILDRPRRYVTRLGKKWKKDGDDVPKNYRFKVAEFITCPWCSGAWTAFAFWGAWEAWPHMTLVVSAPLAISALLALTNRVSD